MLTFNPTDEGTQTQCGRVEIIDDMLGNEPDEEFSVTLVNVTTDGSASACITIIDNDSKFTHTCYFLCLDYCVCECHHLHSLL